MVVKVRRAGVLSIAQVCCKNCQRLQDSGSPSRRSNSLGHWRVVALIWCGRAEESLSAATGARRDLLCADQPEKQVLMQRHSDTGVVCMGECLGPAGAGVRADWNKRYVRWRRCTVLGGV